MVHDIEVVEVDSIFDMVVQAKQNVVPFAPEVPERLSDEHAE